MGEEKMGGWGRTLGDVAEFQCFVCKDAGDVRVCDFRNCLKSYHPGCVGKQDDFIDSSDQYVCDWHKCSNCASDALYLCLCCPSSSACGDCFGKVDFVPVKENKEFNMGFCRSCLNMATVIERDDAEEAKVVFGGTPENYQILFKDYWTILNDKERFTLLDLQLASIRHKRSLKCKEGKDLDEYHKKDGKPLGDNDGAGPPSLLDTMDKPNEVQATFKRKKSGKKTYVGWGSKELIEFLSCIGKDTSKPLEHSKVAEIVREYVRQKDLYDKKKKSVSCDGNLHSLFGKKKLKYNMIRSLLETHLSENAISEDDSDVSEDDNGYRVKKKPRNSLEQKIPKSISGIDPNIAKSVPRINKNCLAALNQNNLNLIYLRKTLVVKFLTELDTFQQKVVGCLVRVKTDIKSYTYQMTKKYYRIGLVTGIKKSSEEYKIKDTRTDVLLCVSSVWDDVKISMLSEEDIEEDECNDLLLSAKKELFKRPTVAELEEKEAIVHADIVNHLVDKELFRLGKELERAREKGWRQEIHDLSCKQELLRTPDERQRRLEVIPEVIPDAEEESKDTEIESAAGNPFQGNPGVTETVADPLAVGLDELPEGAPLRHDTTCEVAFEAAGKPLCNGGSPDSGLCTPLNTGQAAGKPFCNGRSPDPGLCTPLNTVQAAGKPLCNGGSPDPGLHTPLNTGQAAGKPLCNGRSPDPGLHTPLNTGQAAGKPLCNGGSPDPGLCTPLNTGQVARVIDIDNDEDENGPSHHNSCDKQDIVDLVSDDDEDVHMEKREAVSGIAAHAHAHGGPEAVNGVTVSTIRAPHDLDGNTGPARSTSRVINEDVVRSPMTVHGFPESSQMWHYKDPTGQEHGPYTTAKMREWQELGYFPVDFRVWKAGMSERRAVLLVDALRSH